MAGASAVGSSAEVKWFFLDGSSQHIGPYDAATMQGMAAVGTIQPETLVWAEGQPGWVALRDCVELQAAGAAGAAANGAAAVAAPSNGAVGAGVNPEPDPGLARARGVAAKAVRAAPAARLDPELAAFRAEISAIDGDATAGAPSLPEAEAPASPPPDEREFEDDDGTWYAWDPALRKFVAREPAGGAAGGPGGPVAAAAPAYDVADMTFEADEEVIPTYAPPAPDPDSDAEGQDPPAEGGNRGPEEGTSAARQHGSGEPGTSGSGRAPAGRGEPVLAAAGGGAAAAAAAADATPLPAEGAEPPGKPGRKTGAEAVMEKVREKQKRAREAAAKEATWVDLKHTTSVYVQGLPDDVTEAEMVQVFSKCGLIRDGDDGRPRIKIYRDRATGMPKGDGLVTYLKEPSVALACNILDGSCFREDPSKTISVQVAKFEMRGPEYVPKKKPKKSKKLAAKVDKALSWGGFDDQAKATEVTVVLRNVFHPDDFVADPTLRQDLEADMLSECAKLGAVDKVKVYQHSPDGIVTIKFRAPEAAQSCIRLMAGRFFGGRRLEAALWDGVTVFYVPKPAETPEEQAARLEAFARELEAGKAAEQAAATGEDPKP